MLTMLLAALVAVAAPAGAQAAERGLLQLSDAYVAAASAARALPRAPLSLTGPSAEAKAAPGLFAEFPGASPFEKLKSLYEGASTPAKPSDFDDLGANRGQHCWYATSDGVLSEQRAARLVKTLPASGPLFPERKLEKVIFWGYGSADLAPSFFDAIQVSSDKTDLRIHLDWNRGWSDAPWTVLARTSGNFVAYKMVINEGNRYQYEFFGYCYRE